MTTPPNRPVALTIAGFDPSSGAGITADLAVFEANGCFGISAITAMTVQSTVGVSRVQGCDPALLEDTLQCLEDDLPSDGIKIGMLAEHGIVRAIARYLEHLKSHRSVIVVLDPVLVSSSGRTLLDSPGLEALQRDLLPLVDVVTPNTTELSVLSGLPCDSEMELHVAMAQLAHRYPQLSVVATGGHRSQPDDLLLHHGSFTVFPGSRIETRATHGTGCAFSSALLAQMLRKYDLPTAVTATKRYVEGAMQHAEVRGKGSGPMRLQWQAHGKEQR